MEIEQGIGCILVVDDAELARDIEVLFLKKSGYEVIEASDGDDAIEKFTRYNPVLVILDILMPRVDGINALRAIRKINSLALVLICTAVDDYRVIDMALKEGAAGYIIKPYKGSELLNKVRVLLKGRGRNSSDFSPE
ncbi:MAG: response regulator [Methanobacteriota archaeon]